MTRSYGSQSMCAPLRRVLVKRPEDSFAVEDPSAWHYTSRPDAARAREEHDAFVALVRASGAEVLYHDEPQPGRADAIFTHDPVIVTDRGAILLRMGKDLRRGEEAAMASKLSALGVPILGALGGDAQAEGGDLLWLDEGTLAVGRGFRTNDEGVRQLGDLLRPLGVSLFLVDLPYFTGPLACLHLMSLVSLVAPDLAVVYPPLLAVPFWQELARRGIRVVEVPEAELAAMGTNVLALAPRRCVMLEGSPVTQRRLEAAGCEVVTYRGDEISRKAEGGATCLTRPILRG